MEKPHVDRTFEEPQCLLAHVKPEPHFVPDRAQHPGVIVYQAPTVHDLRNAALTFTVPRSSRSPARHATGRASQ